MTRERRAVARYAYRVNTQTKRRPGAASGASSTAPAFLRRADVAACVAGFAAWSDRLVVVLLDEAERVVAHSPSFLVVAGPTGDPVGRPLRDFLTGPTSRGPLFAVSRQAELPLPLLLYAPAVGANYACCIFDVEGGRVLVAEPQVVSDLELVDRMVALTESLGEQVRLARKQNRLLKDAHERATILMHIDPLTGLANRRYLETRLDEAMSQAQRHGHALSLVMADIDHFKAINDRYGHDVGDRALYAFAEVLRGLCRREDVPARFGGEEFLVLLPETVAGSAAAFAERVRAVTAADDPLGTGESVTVSLGVAQLVRGEDAPRLLKRVDEALYAAKVAGRNRVVLHDGDTPREQPAAGVDTG